MNFQGASMTSRGSQRGVALVIALLVVALAAALSVGLSRDFDLNFRRSANTFIADQSWAYLRGAEELAFLALQIDFDADATQESPRDDLNEVWAQQAAPYALDEGGWLSGSLEDLQGRFNLNLLSAPAPANAAGAARFDPAQQMFIRLLQALEGVEVDEFEATRLTEAVADWIDSDDEPRLNGAEASFYANTTPAYRAANAEMQSISELRAIANMRPEVYLALRPFVTVWPTNPVAINIHTAPLTILRAINSSGDLQPLSVEAGQSLLEQRNDVGFESVAELFKAPGFNGIAAESLTPMSSLLGTTSSYFLLTSSVEIADRVQRLYSVLHRQERDISVLQRENAALYDLSSSSITTANESTP